MTMSANKRCQNAVTLEGSMRVELTGSWVGNIVGFHGCRFCDKWLVKSKHKGSKPNHSYICCGQRCLSRRKYEN